MVAARFKYWLVIQILILSGGCSFKLSTSYIKKIRSQDFKEISREVLELFYNNKTDSSILVKDLPARALKQKLNALKIDDVSISFSDSTIVY